jgi:hypothetical protein
MGVVFERIEALLDRWFETGVPAPGAAKVVE